MSLALKAILEKNFKIDLKNSLNKDIIVEIIL